VRTERPDAGKRDLPGGVGEQPAHVHSDAGRHRVRPASPRFEDVVAVETLRAEELLRLGIEGLEIVVPEGPVREIGARRVGAEPGDGEARRRREKRLHRRSQPKVDGIESRNLGVRELERPADRLGKEVHVIVELPRLCGIGAERPGFEQGIRVQKATDRVLELVVAVEGTGERFGIVETRKRISTGLEHEHVLPCRRQHVCDGSATGPAPDDTEVEARQAPIPEDVV
jgi:hypothetical protein